MHSDRPEIYCPVTALGVAVDNRSLETMFLYHVSTRYCHVGTIVGNAARPPKRLGWRLTDCKPFIGIMCYAYGRGRVELFYSGRVQSQYLHIDTGGIHSGQPAIIEIADLLISLV